MDEQVALTFAIKVWGRHAFACKRGGARENTLGGYVVGYNRVGKTGRRLATVKGRSYPWEGFKGAFENALHNMRGTAAGDRLGEIIMEIRSC